jgi:hypothetical protein
MVEKCPGIGDARVWCGYCYANVTGRAAFRGHRAYRAYRPPPHETLAMALKKRDATPAGDDGAQAPGQFGVKHPLLFEMLTLTVWPDGEERVRSTITLFAAEKGIKASLNDKDQGLSCFAHGKTVEEAFLALERGLEKDSLEWGPNGQGPAPKKKRRK